MNGILYVNKPEGCTSRDVVNQICRIYHTKKVGHTGTLDPMATGVLIIAIGKATKLVDELTSLNKTYIASVQMGILTDTLDTTGTILSYEEVPKFSFEQVDNALCSFVGVSMQEVPIYSAIKVNGRKLYEYARNGEKVELPMREIEVHSIRLISFEEKTFTFEVEVSKGTYIRSLIRDIGEKLGVFCSMSELCRSKQGSVSIEQCYSLEKVSDSTPLIALDVALGHYPICIVGGEDLKKVRNGANISRCEYDDKVRIHDEEGTFLALYKVDAEANVLKSDIMFL